MFRSTIHLIAEQLKSRSSINFARIPILFILLSSFTVLTIVTTNYTTSTMDNNNAFAQRTPQEDILNTTNKINIDMNSVTFAPLTDSSINQLKILVNYQTIDSALVNTPMAGIMKVFLSDGSLIKTSSIPKGYVVGQSGVIQFATSFNDQAIQNVRTEVYMINTSDEIISNILSINASLTK